MQNRPLQPKFISGHRVGPFTGRCTDVGAVLDLMIHDLDLVLTLLRSPVRSVEAVGLSILGGHEDIAHARLTFDNGCIADLAASRISLQPSRRMQIWGPEGYVELDFARRHLTLVQPSEELLRHRSTHKPFDGAARQTLKNELVGRHLQVLELDCNHGDPLSRELEDFIRCVRSGSRPRASGEAGRDAVALAVRVVESLEKHAWNGDPYGACGPLNLPPALGCLFTPPAQRQAA